MTDPTPTAEPLRKIPAGPDFFDTFTSAEVMAMQREFECDWTDITGVVGGKVSGRTRGQTNMKLINSKGRVRFSNEALAWMIWTVYRRDDPDAKLAPLLDLLWGDLVELLEPAEGKAGPAKRSKTTT